MSFFNINIDMLAGIYAMIYTIRALDKKPSRNIKQCNNISLSMEVLKRLNHSHKLLGYSIDVF